MGEARNALVVAASSTVIAIGGEYGTLSEIAFALRSSKPVIGLSIWSLIRPGGVADDRIVCVANAAWPTPSRWQ
jgi:predicted Rossmann-fold nucleotide-binding protein